MQLALTGNYGKLHPSSKFAKWARNGKITRMPDLEQNRRPNTTCADPSCPGHSDAGHARRDTTNASPIVDGATIISTRVPLPEEIVFAPRSPLSPLRCHAAPMPANVSRLYADRGESVSDRPASPTAAETLMAAFVAEVRDRGWVEGQHFGIERRITEPHLDSAPGSRAKS